MNPKNRAMTMMEQLERALYIRASLGVRSAAGYMKARGWSLEAALWWLCRRV